MKKIHWRLLGIITALALPLALSGCQTPNANTADQPSMLYYNPDYNNSGIINTDGVMIAPPDGSQKTILYQDGKQAYLYTKETIYDKENRNQWGEPTYTGAIFNFYTPDGELVKTVDLSDKGDVFFYSDQKDPLQGYFLCNNIEHQNTVEVLDSKGSTIITIEPDQQASYGHSSMITGSDWLWLGAYFYDTDNMIYSKEATYTTSGKPLNADRKYTNMWRIYDYVDETKEEVYFQAFYTNSDGQECSDIIDANGNVRIEGITDCSMNVGDLLIVEKDNKRGLIDIDGNWLYYQTPDGQTMTTQPAPTDSQQPPAVMYFYGYNGTGIINSLGQMILPPDNTTSKTIAYNDDGTTPYIYTTTNYMDYQNTNRWGSPRITGAEYNFYSTTGELITTVDLRDKGEISFRTGDTPEESIFLCNMTELGGDLEVIRGDGQSILTIPMNIPEDNRYINSYAYISLFENWLQIEYNVTNYANGQNVYLAGGTAFYTLDGQPMTFAQDYSTIWDIWSYDGNQSQSTGYYQASYTNSQDKYLHDILDSDGNVVLSGLSMVGNFCDGLLVCERGSDRGLIDLQSGNWIYRESVFNTLDD